MAALAATDGEVARKLVFGLRRQPDDQPVKRGLQLQLAAQARIAIYKKGLVEHVGLVVGHLGQCMVALYVYLTGGTKRHTAAGAFDRELVGLAQLHEVEIHVRRGRELVCLCQPVDDGDGYFIVRHNTLILAANLRNSAA